MRNTVHIIINALLIFLFVYTGISKLLTLGKNEAVLSHLPYIGSYAAALALLIPFAELCIAVLLTIPRFNKAGLYISLILLTTFTVYLLYMLASGEKLPCTCGGVLEKMTWKQHVLFNFCFIVLNLVALQRNKQRKSKLLTHST